MARHELADCTIFLLRPNAPGVGERKLESSIARGQPAVSARIFSPPSPLPALGVIIGKICWVVADLLAQWLVDGSRHACRHHASTTYLWPVPAGAVRSRSPSSISQAATLPLR
jgi:hypothetical protein